MAAIKYVLKYIGDIPIPDWNDDKLRTKADVINILEKAIDDATTEVRPHR